MAHLKKALDGLVTRLGTFCGMISGICLFGMMALVATDVLRRLLFNSPILGGYEICQMLMVIVVLMGMPYALSQKAIIHVTFLLPRLPKPIRHGAWALLQIMGTGVFLLFGYGTLIHGLFLKERGAVSGTIAIPFWPFYMIAAFGLFIYALIQLYDSLKAVAAIFSEKYALEISEQWKG